MILFDFVPATYSMLAARTYLTATASASMGA